MQLITNSNETYQDILFLKVEPQFKSIRVLRESLLQVYRLCFSRFPIL